MKIIQILKDNTMLLIAGLAIVGFSSFKMINNSQKIAASSVPLYFHGDTEDPDSVADPENWTEESNGENCQTGDVACSMTVQDTDLTGTAPNRELDPTKIQLSAVSNGSGEYAPIKSSGSGSQPEIHNRN